MADMNDHSFVAFISHDEATRGQRRKLRDELVKSNWVVNKDVNEIYPGADFVWLTKRRKFVGVQSKTITDFLHSWFSGRLQRQMINMMGVVDIAVLLLEGIPWLDYKTGAVRDHYGLIMEGNHPIPYDSYVNSIADLTGFCQGRFILVPSPDMKYTIRWLTEIGPKKFDDDSYNGWARIEIPERNGDKALQMLLSWEGLGEVRAKALLRKYATPEVVMEILRNDPMRLTEVEGIGKGTVEAIVKQKRSRYMGE